MASGLDAAMAHPTQALGAAVGVVVLTWIWAFTLRRVAARLATLRAQLLVITASGIALGAFVAWILAALMIVEEDALGAILVVLTVTAVVGSTIVVAASTELGAAAQGLAAKVRAIEAGERAPSSGIDRVDELGQVDAALDQLAHQLGRLEADRQRLDRERSVMLSSISHDLRSPLAALRAAVDAMLDGVAPDPQRYLRSMRADVDALASLVDDVFLLTSLDGGELQMGRERVDLADCCDEAIEALTPAAHAQGVHLELVAEHRVLVPANSRALGRVVRNLVDNAVRHAPPGSTVTVTVGRSGRPVVTVSDEGDGFPAGFAEVAFDRWTRPDQSRSRMTGGSGLGLAIAHGLVAAHGGRIWIDESPGGQVSFELPALN
jgi:two-component system sensor histidine kinase BaeS